MLDIRLRLRCVWTGLGFRLLGDFRDVARSVDYLVTDLQEGWLGGHTHDVLACVWRWGGGLIPETNVVTPSLVSRVTAEAQIFLLLLPQV